MATRDGAQRVSAEVTSLSQKRFRLRLSVHTELHIQQFCRLTWNTTCGAVAKVGYSRCSGYGQCCHRHCKFTLWLLFMASWPRDERYHPYANINSARLR